MAEDIGGRGKAQGDIADDPAIAAPVAAHGGAIAVIPLGPARREASEAITTLAEIPWFRDELHLSEHRILCEDVEKGSGRVEPRRTARQYAELLHTVPWYDFPFEGRLEALWRETPLWGLDFIRKWERRFSLSAEYSLKATYAGIIRLGTHAVQQPHDLVIHAWIDEAPDHIFDDDRIRKIKAVGARSYVVTIPRHEAFTPVVVGLVKRGVQFRELAGNDEILLTAMAPSALDVRLGTGEVLLKEPLLTNPGATRIAVKAPVASLRAVLTELTIGGATVERLYDY